MNNYRKCKSMIICVITAMLTVLTVLFACLPMTAFAADTNEIGHVKVEDDVLLYTCRYNSEDDSVTVSGSMESSAFTEFRESTIEIYRVPIGYSEYEAVMMEGVEPLASGEVSLRFGFSFKAESYLDKYVRYAVFLRSPDGKLLLGTEAQYPEMVSSVDRPDDRSGFKGAYDNDCFDAADTKADSAVIPVYLNRLFTEDSGGYIYRLDGQKLFFSKKYIDEIDARIRVCTLSGAKVYLQLLLDSKDSFNITLTGSQGYYMPDVYDLNTVSHLYSAVDFLTVRYGVSGEGALDGYIVGKAWRYNYTADIAFENFADHCAAYVALVANCARSTDPSIDVVMSFSGANFNGTDKVESYSTKQLMERIFSYFDRTFSYGLDCSVMIETAEIPFGITNDNIDNGVDISYDNYTAGVYAGGQSIVSDWLDTLSARYSGVPEDYIFSWDPPQSLKGNALTVAYVYSYYALLCDARVSCFLIDGLGTSKAVLAGVRNTVKYIDTDQSATVTDEVLSLFGVNSWTELPGIAAAPSAGTKSIYSARVLSALPDSVDGSFDYFDFSKGVLAGGWYRGVGCNSLQTKYDSTQSRAVRADMSAEGEILHEYEHHESLIYTPYINFDLRIDGDNEGALYEVSFVLENSVCRTEASCIVSGGERTSAVLVLPKNEQAHTVEYFKIKIRTLYSSAENSDNATLWLYGISGHSTDRNTEELSELIEEERSKIRQVDEEDSSSGGFKQTAFIVAILFFTGAFGIGIFIIFRRGTKGHREE